VAGGRQADAAPALLEQRGAAGGLEPVDAAGQRGLRAMQPLGGAAHVLELGDHFEVLEIAQVQGGSDRWVDGWMEGSIDCRAHRRLTRPVALG
jgi:hypothetical protein